MDSLNSIMEPNTVVKTSRKLFPPLKLPDRSADLCAEATRLLDSPLPEIWRVDRLDAFERNRDGLQEFPQSAPHGVSDAGKPGSAGTATAGPVVQLRPLWAANGSPGGVAAVRFARRPALCQRRCAHWHSVEQDSQGSDPQVEVPARLPNALRSRLGLPWPAHRVQGDPGTARPRQVRCRCHHNPNGLRRLRPQVHRLATPAISAPRCSR